MTLKQNITSILECHFSGFKDELIEACANRIMEQIERQADTPLTEELKCRNKSYYESCEYEDNCDPIVCLKALDELQDALTDCDHKNDYHDGKEIQRRIGKRKAESL